MVAINYAFREISCKIVYYGPGLSGKTTNLQYVHNRVPAKSRGDLISLATEADRTLYFDFLPIHVGDIGGFSTKFQLYTVPGQVFYNATRKLVLRGVDGIVFVADSQQAKMDENIESLANMYENLRENDIDHTTLPIVFQYNKRDLPEILSIEELQQALNPNACAHAEACAVTGQGVFDTMKRITKLVLEETNRRTSGGKSVTLVPSTAPAARGVTSRPSTDVLVTTGPVSTLPRTVEKSGDRWNTDRRSAVGIAQEVSSAAISTAVDSAEPSGRETQQEPLSIPHSNPPRHDNPIRAAQRSTRIRRRNRSLFDRLFGWILGR